MKRRFAPIALWTAATTATIILVSGVVQLVGSQVAESSVQPLSFDGLIALGSSDPSETSDAPDGSASEGRAQPVPAVSEAQVDPSSDETPTEATTSDTTEGPLVVTEVSVHQLVGGTVAIEAGPDSVTVLWATPRAGFTVKIRQQGPKKVSVEFLSPDHESDFTARWHQSDLAIEIDERDRSK